MSREPQTALRRTPDALSAGAARRWLGALLVASFVISVVPAWWGLPSWIGWAFDEILPQQVTGAWPLRYPPLHRHVLRALHGTLDVARASGVVELDGRRLHHARFLLGRLLSAGLATLIVALVYSIGRRLLDRPTALLAAALFAFSPTLAYYAKTANLDVPYLFWYAASLLCFLRALETRRASAIAAFAALGMAAICTKDQAYGLFVLSPVAIALSLAAERAADVGWPRAFLRAWVDRRMLLAGAAATGCLALVYGVGLGSDELSRHVVEITDRPYESYRSYPSTPFGHLQMTLQSLENLRYVMGTPALLAAFYGLWRILRAHPRRWLAAAPLTLVVPYYLLFIQGIGYNFDRHFLPIVLVLSLYAAFGLRSALARSGTPPRLATALLALVLAFGIARAASLDLLMLGDARYAAEEWIAERAGRDRIVGLGEHEMLPRGIEVVPQERFRPETVHENRMAPGGWHDCRVLRALEADYLIPSIPSSLVSPDIGYRVARTFTNPFDTPLSRTGLAATNLEKIRRTVEVFAPAEEPCVERKPALRLLQRLRQSQDPALETELLALATSESGSEQGVVLSGDEVFGVGLDPDGWTRGREAAAVVARNPLSIPLWATLKGTSEAPEDVHPITVSVRGGAFSTSFTIARPGPFEIELPPVPPRERRLWVLWSDREWHLSRRPHRLVGVRLIPGGRYAALVSRLRRAAADPRASRALAREMLDGKVKAASRLRGGYPSIGLRDNGWTYGSEIGAIALPAPDRRARVSVRLLCPPPAAGRPVTVELALGSSRRVHVCGRAGRTSVRAGLLHAGRQGLLFVHARGGPGGGAPRQVGVRVLGIAMPGHAGERTPPPDPR